MIGDESTILSRKLIDCALTWRRYSITLGSEHILASVKFPQIQLTLTLKELYYKLCLYYYNIKKSFTIILHAIGGHGPLWQGFEHGWLQSDFGKLHGNRHGPVLHGGAWHGLVQVCLLQGSGMPQGIPHDTFFIWHGIANRS